MEGTSELILRVSSAKLLDETFSLESAGLRDSVETYDPLPFLLSLNEGGRKASIADLAALMSWPGRCMYSSMSVTRSRDVATR